MVAVQDVIMLQNQESSPTHSFAGHIDVVFVHIGLRPRNVPFTSRPDVLLDLFPYPVRGLYRPLFRGAAEEVLMWAAA